MGLRLKWLTGCLIAATALLAGTPVTHAAENETNRELLSWTLIAGKGGERGQLGVKLRGSEKATLDAWLDFDGDGFFDEAQERIIDRAAIEPGMSMHSFELPLTAALSASSRIRFRVDGLEGETLMDQETLAFPERIVDPGCSWSPGFGGSGPNDHVYAFEVFDGALYVGGNLNVIDGTILSQRVARWDGHGWQKVGGDELVDGDVRTLETFNDGSGARLYAGTDAPPYFFRLNGAVWEPIPDMTGPVLALKAWDDGTGPALFVGGDFSNAGQLGAGDGILKWLGSGWQTVGSGLPVQVNALEIAGQDGAARLYAGGGTTNLNGFVRSWNGTAWSVTNLPLMIVYALRELAGTLYAGGSAGVRRLQGTQWSSVMASGRVNALEVFDDGSGPALYAGGEDLAAPGRLARLDGSSWTYFGTLMDDPIRALATYPEPYVAPALFVGGHFTETNAKPQDTTANLRVNYISRFDASGFSSLSSGMDDEVWALTKDPNQLVPDLFATGVFSHAGGLEAMRYARWDGRWHRENSGLLAGSYGRDVLVDGQGAARKVYVATRSDGGDNGALFELQGSTWRTLGTMNQQVMTVAKFGGSIYVGGRFTSINGSGFTRIAAWDGVAWRQVPAPANLFDGTIWALEVLDYGQGPRLVAAGEFTSRIAVWNGSQWSNLGGPQPFNGFLRALAVHDDGTGPKLHAAGDNVIARWNGSQWTTIGSVNGSIWALASYSDGSRSLLAAGGEFSSIGLVAAKNFALRDGHGWNAVGSGANQTVMTLVPAKDADGRNLLYAGGAFTSVNGLPSAYVTRLECPAPIVDFDAAIEMNSESSILSIGGPVDYQIVVRNDGPATVTGLVVEDLFSTEVQGCIWTAMGTIGASGQQDGAGGVLLQTLTLAPAARVTYDIGCNVAATAAGTIENAATLTAALDTNPANDRAQVAHTVRAPAINFDAAITKTSTSTFVVAGGEVGYRIEVRNNGPDTAAGLKVEDVFPTEVQGCSWTASATLGASGQQSGSDAALRQTLNLPLNARVTYEIDCTVGAAAEGVIENLATLAPGDRDPGNDQARVTHVVRRPPGSLHGDCNRNGLLDNPDLDAFHSEIFDGDGAYPEFTPSPDFLGDPVGCNANDDDTVDAGDLSCLARKLAGQSCPTGPSSGGLPRLSMLDVVRIENRQIHAEIRFNPAQQAINTVAFELSFDAEKVALPANLDAAFQSHQAQALLYKQVDGNSIVVAIRQPVGQGQLAEGKLLTITFDVLPGQQGDTVHQGVAFSARTAPSYGNTSGQSVLGLARMQSAVVRTLVVTHSTRLFEQQSLGFGIDQQRQLRAKLEVFLEHDRVKGMLIDLATDPDLRQLYADWDASGQPAKANEVLFGRSGRRGLHQLLRELEAAFPQVEHLLLLGDDRIVPFARLPDDQGLAPGHLTEKDYTNGSVEGGLPAANDSTVKRALAANFFLSDDPLASRDPVGLGDLGPDDFVLPGLGVGRLVENASEILGAFDTFLERDGRLDLQSFDPEERQVLVSGYDFSNDGARAIGDLWRQALGSAPEEMTPVDSSLLGNQWFAADLFEAFEQSGARLFSVNGHATHDLVGSPDNRPFGLYGVPALDLYGEDFCGSFPATPAVDLSGAVVIAMSCHGGLPVPGSCGPLGPLAERRSLDLAQTFLARGALAYGDNSGFGWGLREGIGLGERLAVLIHRRLSGVSLTTGSPVVGTAVRQAKLDYYLQQLEFDEFDRKSLMQWTLYGFPMVELVRPAGFAPPAEPESVFEQRDGSETGNALAEPLPANLTRLLHHGELSPADYHRVELGGDIADSAPCPVAGCYWQWNGLTTDEVGLPMQPFTTLGTTLAETIQRGVLWMGAAYEVEFPFHPVVATPISSEETQTPSISSLPIRIYQQPTGPNGGGYLGGPAGCHGNSGDQNRAVLLTGELRKLSAEPDVWEGRRYLSVDVETLHLSTPAVDCDLPVFGAPPFDHAEDGELRWHVPVTDAGSGVWRVIAVWDDELAREWKSVDLVRNGGVWEGSLPADPRQERVTYFLQAVDREGNVAWWERTEELPLVTRRLLEPIVREIGPPLPPDPALFADGFESGDCSAWESASGC